MHIHLNVFNKDEPKSIGLCNMRYKQASDLPHEEKKILWCKTRTNVPGGATT